MPSVTVSKVIDASIEDVWEVVRPFDRIAEILPPISNCELEDGKAPTEVGVVRRLEVEDNVIREQLVELSDREHRCVYSYLDYPLPVEDRTSRIELFEVTDGDQTLARWTTSFDIPDEHKEDAVESARDVYTLGLNELAKHVES